MRLKKAFALMITLCAAALAGCSTPKSGKPNSTNSSASAGQVMVTPSLDGAEQNGQEISFSGDGTLLYDKCGVKLTLTFAESGSSTLLLSAENTSDKNYTLRSMYVMEGDVMYVEPQSLWIPLQSGETSGSSLELPLKDGILRMKLYLTGEDFSVVEDSISDTIAIEKSSLRKLKPSPLGLPVYEDDSVKLILAETWYQEDSNEVDLVLAAYNKTDEDLYLRSLSSVCEHSDYRFRFGGYVPANSLTYIFAKTNTTNKTLTPAELQSITFTLSKYAADEYLLNSFTAEPLDEIKGVRIDRDRSKDPEVIVPQEITEKGSRDDLISELLEDGFTELPEPEDGDLVFENESVRIEYITGSQGEYSGSAMCMLGFRFTNKLGKQIRLEAFGMVNGATAEFYDSISLPPMTEDYEAVCYDMPDPERFGSFADAEIMFMVGYDDGHNDESSFICSTDKMKIVTGKRADTSGALEGAEKLYSDDDCELWLIGKRLGGKTAYLTLYALNKTDSPAQMYIYDNSEDIYFFGAVDILPKTYCVTIKRLRSLTDSDLTDEDIAALALEIEFEPTATDTDDTEPDAADGGEP